MVRIGGDNFGAGGPDFNPLSNKGKVKNHGIESNNLQELPLTDKMKAQFKEIDRLLKIMESEIDETKYSKQDWNIMQIQLGEAIGKLQAELRAVAGSPPYENYESVDKCIDQLKDVQALYNSSLAAGLGTLSLIDRMTITNQITKAVDIFRPFTASGEAVEKDSNATYLKPMSPEMQKIRDELEAVLSTVIKNNTNPDPSFWLNISKSLISLKTRMEKQLQQDSGKEHRGFEYIDDAIKDINKVIEICNYGGMTQQHRSKIEFDIQTLLSFDLRPSPPAKTPHK